MFSQNDLALHRSRLPIARNPRNILETGEPNKMTCIGVMRILCGYTGMLEPDPAVHGYYNCCEKESRLTFSVMKSIYRACFLYGMFLKPTHQPQIILT